MKSKNYNKSRKQIRITSNSSKMFNKTQTNLSSLVEEIELVNKKTIVNRPKKKINIEIPWLAHKKKQLKKINYSWFLRQQ